MFPIIQRFMAGAACLLLLAAAPVQPAHAEESLSNGIGQGNPWSHSWVDVNGDGRSDYCYLTGTDGRVVRCHFASAEGRYASAPSLERDIDRTSDGNLWWADVDGDGRPDLCRADAASYFGQTTQYSGPTHTVWCRLAKNLFAGPSVVTRVPAAYDAYDEASGTTTSYRGIWNMTDLQFADVNVDQLTDVCFVNHHSVSGPASDLRCHLSTGEGFSGPSAAWTTVALNAGNADLPRVLVDFDGNGFPDFCRAPDDGTLKCLLGSEGGFTATDISSSALDRGHAKGAAFIDFNADGKTDYCRITGTSTGNYRLRCTLSTGLSWDVANERVSPVIASMGHATARWWIDINADGLPDYCRSTGTDPDDPRDAVGQPNIDISDTAGTLSCRLNKGDGSATDAVGGFYYDDITVDVNFGAVGGARHWCDPVGQGLPVLCRNSRKQVFQTPVCTDTNSEGGSPTWECTPAVVSEAQGLLTGLGTTDKPQAFHPLLLSYTDGLGAETRITYRPLTSADVYSRSGTGVSPRRVIGPPPSSPVVYETRAWTTEADAAGTGLTLTGNARYFYRDLTQDMWAGASRGFRERWMFSEGTNTFDRTVFFQGLGDAVEGTTPQGASYGSIENDPREIGLVKQQERYAVNGPAFPKPTAAEISQRASLLGNILSKIVLTAVGAPPSGDGYLLLQRTDNRLADTSTPNPRYRYIGRSDAQAWDLDGTTRIPLPSSSTTTVQDQFGNVESLTQVRTQAAATGSLTWQTRTDNTYDSDAKWRRLGRLKRSTVTSSAPSLDAQLAALPRSAGTAPNASAVSSPLAAVPQEAPKPLPLPPQLLMPILQLLLDD